MKFFRVLSIVVLAGVGLSSCSLKLQLMLFNASGEAVTVITEGAATTIGSGESRQFDYPGGDQNWTLHLSVAACEYVYLVPKSLADYPVPVGSTGPFKAQIVKNFEIYALPASATGPVAVAGLGPEQRDGFPLHPSSKTCH